VSAEHSILAEKQPDEATFFPEGMECPVWSPTDEFEAAAVLQWLLAMCPKSDQAEGR
jgi:hypothetical protein